MSQAVFHLGVTKSDLAGASLAIIPGDPARVIKIAEEMDNPVFLGHHREYTVYRAELNGQPVIVCSTGIGGPSTSIAVEELAQLGIRTFLRVGTTGRPNELVRREHNEHRGEDVRTLERTGGTMDTEAPTDECS